jgi:hypothetical protein
MVETVESWTLPLHSAVLYVCLNRGTGFTMEFNAMSGEAKAETWGWW